MSIVRRGKTLYLRKRVPRRYQPVEPREFVLLSLHTDSETAAKAKAEKVWSDHLDAWEARLEGDESGASISMEAAKELAAKRGFRWMTARQIAKEPLAQVLERVEAVGRGKDRRPDPVQAAAFLGGAKPPKLTVSAALNEFWRVEMAKTAGKSQDQIRRWENPRKKAVANFIEVVGDRPISEITTEEMFEFREWWQRRVVSGDVKPSSANKDFIHLTAVIGAVARAKGIKLLFKLEKFNLVEKEKGVRPPFSLDWIKDKLLAPKALDRLNGEARAILLGMVNTGYRPSEGAMLTADQIRLADNVPHIRIEPVGRELKTANARRVIPLTGVSLEAFRQYPGGFPRYADNPALSDTVNKFLREHGLLETDRHSMYSLRHSFEDRLLAGGVDERIRRDLLGHALKRERYGAGADLNRLHQEVSKVAI